MRNVTILAAVILTLMIIPATIYALQTPMGADVRNPEEVALDFIKSSPTFRFDGLTSTLKVVNVTTSEGNLREHLVTLGFDCLHGGYGDRSDEMITQTVTSHAAYVTVSEGKITSALLDGEWDEMTQKTVADEAKSTVEEIALNWLINAPTYKFDGVAGSAIVTDSFQAMTFAAPSFWGVTVEFDCLHPGFGDRSGQILAQVITHHAVTIHVTDGQVTLAPIDDIWDELTQKPIGITYTPEMAEQTALSWLYTCPTFMFDGVTETVKVVEVMTVRMISTWEVAIKFTCGYPGYGDRTGNVMLGHSQSHTIKITVTEGQVRRAIIDDMWDELNQFMLESQTVIGPEEVRDIAINYVFAKLGIQPAAFTWLIEDLTPQGLLGVQIARYISGEWNVTVENAVVLNPVYTVTVSKNNEALWTFKVGQGGEVIDENEPTQTFYTTDVARKLCLDYLTAKHPEVAVQMPLEWTEKNIVPEGMLGLTKIQYTNGDWTIVVSAPVVWNPTYNVTVSYSGAQGAFTWQGIVPNGGIVQELKFNK